MMRHKQKGFTVVELIITIFAGLMVIGVGFGLYAIIHFIAKFW